MELAFWDPTTVGGEGAADSPAAALPVDPMQAVGSMGFEEMLQWMEMDTSKPLPEPITSKADDGMDIPAATLPSQDFQGLLDDLSKPTPAGLVSSNSGASSHLTAADANLAPAGFHAPPPQAAMLPSTAMHPLDPQQQQPPTPPVLPPTTAGHSLATGSSTSDSFLHMQSSDLMGSPFFTEQQPLQQQQQPPPMSALRQVASMPTAPPQYSQPQPQPLPLPLPLPPQQQQQLQLQQQLSHQTTLEQQQQLLRQQQQQLMQQQEQIFQQQQLLTRLGQQLAGVAAAAAGGAGGAGGGASAVGQQELHPQHTLSLPSMPQGFSQLPGVAASGPEAPPMLPLNMPQAAPLISSLPAATAALPSTLPLPVSPTMPAAVSAVDNSATAAAGMPGMNGQQPKAGEAQPPDGMFVFKAEQAAGPNAHHQKTHPPPLTGATGRPRGSVMDYLDEAQKELQKREGSLYSQMLKNSDRSGAPKPHGRSNSKAKLNDLEKQVAELQSQKSTLTEETNNMQCRLNILDRMMQLRKENAETIMDQVVQMTEQMQMAELVKETQQMSCEESAKPQTKTLPKIFHQDYSPSVFEEISSKFKVFVEDLTSMLHEIDALPIGSDVPQALSKRLDDTLKTQNEIFTQYQVRGGGSVVQQWMATVYKKTTKEQPTIVEEYNLNYRQIYPLLRLTREQKERVKVSFEVFKKRCCEMQADRDDMLRDITSISVDSSLSAVDRCREEQKSQLALRKLQTYTECLKECHIMIVLMVMHKILNKVQFARLIVTSYPFLPCPYKLFEVVEEDLDRSASTAQVVTSAKAAASEILKVVKPCSSPTCAAPS